MTAATTAELHLIASYDKYKRSLKVVNDARIRADDLLRSAVKQMMSQPTSVRRAVIARFNVAASSSSSSTAINPSAARTPNRLPTLNATERALLMEHEGCFKCRRFYMSHKSADCPDGFPDKSSYTTLTEADALNAKKHIQKKNKTHAAAVVSPPVVATVNTMAAVAAVVMPSAVLGDGSDSEYVLAPFFEPHFFFDCVVGGSTASSQISI